MNFTNTIILFGLLIFFPIIILGAVRKPSFGLAVLLFSLPLLSQARRLFLGREMPYLSIETLAVLVLCLFVLIHDIRKKKFEKVDLSLFIFTIVFLITSLVSAVFAIDSDIALKILFSGGVSPLICFYIAKKHINSREDFNFLLFGLFGLVLQTAIFSILAYDKRLIFAPQGAELASWLYQISNPIVIFGSPSAAIATIVPSIPFAAWYRIYGRWNNNLTWIIVTISAITVSILSLSRGSWLGITIALIASLPLYFKKIQIRIIIFIILLLLIFYFTGYYDIFFQMIETRLTTTINTINIRTENYKLAIQSSIQHTISGLGLGNYRYLYKDFPFALASQLPPLWFAHSLFLTLIPEIGLVGALSFFYIFFSRIIKGIRVYRNLKYSSDKLLIYSFLVAITSYIIIVSTSGGHLVATLSDYLIAPALIVIFSLLGCLSGKLKFLFEVNQLILSSKSLETVK